MKENKYYVKVLYKDGSMLHYPVFGFTFSHIKLRLELDTKVKTVVEVTKDEKY